MARKLETQRSRSTKLKNIRDEAEQGVQAMRSMSGREIEAMKKENILSNKQKLKTFRVYKTPSLNRIFASKEELEERINNFLGQYDGVDLTKAIPPTLNELATAIGYVCTESMMKYIADHPNEEMSNAMLYAVGQVKQMHSQKKYILGSKRQDWKAFDSEIDRIDSIVSGTAKTEKKSVKDTETERKREETGKLTREEIAKRLSDLSSLVYDDGVNPIIEDAEYSEIEVSAEPQKAEVV